MDKTDIPFEYLHAATAIICRQAYNKRADVSDLQKHFEATVPEDMRTEVMSVATQCVFGTSEKSIWGVPSDLRAA